MARPASRPNGARRPNPALRLAAIRQFHVYLGVFIAPSILFFALTGALQLFSLHEAHGDYRPPALIEKLAAVHKDQKFESKPPRPAPNAAHHADADDNEDADHDHAGAHETAMPVRTLALKWLFLVVAIGLVASTCLGLWMGLLHSRRKGVAWLLLILGAVLPVLILAL